MKRISEKVIGLIEWESPILDMSFMDGYDKEVDVLLQAQLEADEKDHQAEIREIFEEIDKIVTQLISQGFIESEYVGFLKERVQALKSKHIKEE